MHCDWVEESRAPRRLHRAGAAADVPKGVEVPLHLSLLIQPSRDFKVYRNEMESVRGKKENQPIGFG